MLVSDSVDQSVQLRHLHSAIEPLTKAIFPIMVLADSLLIVGISLFTAFLGEAVTWFLVYRTEKYVKLKAEIEKQTRKREK